MNSPAPRDPNRTILVVLEAHPEAARLMRAAKRKAEKLGCRWEILLIETPNKHRQFSAAQRETLLNLTTLGEQMGATISKIYAFSTLNGIVRAVQERQQQGLEIVSIKLADIRGTRFVPRFFLLKNRLDRALKGTVHITAIPLGVSVSVSKLLLGQFHITKSEIAISFCIVALCTITIELTRFFQPEFFDQQTRNKTIIYLIGAMLASARYGFLSGLLTGIIALFTLKFLYIPPFYNFTVSEPADALNLSLFVVASVITAIIGNKDYGDRLTLAKRSDRFHALLSVHRLALTRTSMEETLRTLDKELRHLLRTEVLFFLPSLMDDRKLEVLLGSGTYISESDKNALMLSWEECKTTGTGAPFNPPGCNWRFEPMVTANDEIGILAIHINDQIDLDEDFGRLTSGIADQVALIIERQQLGQLAEETRIQAEREKLRAMLLSSVSHDLKTPLASVIGSLSVYRSMGANLPPEHRLTLIDTALDEAQRLDSFITNILDMTRIESGQVEMRAEWMNPELIISDVLKRLRDRLRLHPVQILPPATPLEASMDTLMTGQVIQNLLDNAAKYTRPGTAIDISWQLSPEGGLQLTIRDHGTGIPEDQIEKIFDKYTRLRKQDSQVAGTGLGLAIARAVMRAQGGSVQASNHPEGGAQFILSLPQARPLPKQEAA